MRGLLLAVLLLPASSAAWGQRRYPGSSWGKLADNLHSDVEGAAVLGFVNQGIDWTTLPGGVPFNTFVEARYRFRDLNRPYYDAAGAAVGAQLSKGPFRAGVDYYWERYPDLVSSSNKAQLFLQCYQDWDLKRALDLQLPVAGLSGSTWLSLTYDDDSIAGGGSMGYASQGIDWVKLPLDAVLGTFGEFGWRERALNHDYYNTYWPAIGISVQRESLRAGLSYAWEFYPSLDRRVDTLQLFLTYYASWDLRRR